MKDYKKIYRNTLSIKWDSNFYEIHHIDMDRTNNNISNLILLPKKLHKRLHACYSKISYYGNILAINNFNHIYLDEKVVDEYLSIKSVILQQKINKGYVLTGMPIEYYIKFLEELSGVSGKIEVIR